MELPRYNLLEELYYGNIQPYSKCFDPDSKYAYFLSSASDCEEELAKILASLENPTEKTHLLTMLMNAQNELLDFSELEHFMEGFQLGARLMLDTFVSPGSSVIRDIE